MSDKRKAPKPKATSGAKQPKAKKPKVKARKPAKTASGGNKKPEYDGK